MNADSNRVGAHAPGTDPRGHLVVSREEGEKVILFIPSGYKPPEGGQEIEVEVADIRGDRVRLGFRAPEAIDIYREELVGGERSEESPDKESFRDNPHPHDEVGPRE